MLGRLLKRKRKPPQETPWLEPQTLKSRLKAHAQVENSNVQTGPEDLFHAPVQPAARPKKLQRQNAFLTPTPCRSETASPPVPWQATPPEFAKEKHVSWPSSAMPPCHHISIFLPGHLAYILIALYLMSYVLYTPAVPSHKASENRAEGRSWPKGQGVPPCLEIAQRSLWTPLITGALEADCRVGSQVLRCLPRRRWWGWGGLCGVAGFLRAFAI